MLPTERLTAFAKLAQTQLFFVGGAPRSGTTWLQQMLDWHPNISCRGEGLFWKHLAEPIDALMARRAEALSAKNTELFAHTGGYPLPAQEDADMLIATGILAAFQRQAAGRNCLAIGEKTPENVFAFPRLKRIFPAAKCIAIVRDPRDVLASAWHFFHKPVAPEHEAAAKLAFVRSALPSLDAGTRAIIALREHYANDTAIVTYESLRQNPAPILAELFRFLGVSDCAEIIADCTARTDFAALAAARTGAPARPFLRKGVTGDWQSTLGEDLNIIIMQDLAWMFPHFGWQPAPPQ